MRLQLTVVKAFLERRGRLKTGGADGVAADRIAIVVGALGRKLLRALRRVAAKMFGQPIGGVAEIGQRRERRLANAKDRAEIEEDRWAQAHFLGAGAPRNIEHEPTPINNKPEKRRGGEK